jgi:hypothetical protein
VTKLDLVLARIRKLPPERQEAVAVQIDFLLNDEEEGSVLTDEQWAQVEATLANKNEPVISHDDVFSRLEADEK